MGQRLIILLATLSALIAFAPLFFSPATTSHKNATAGRRLTLSEGKLAWLIPSLIAVVVLVVYVAPMPWVAIAFGRQTYKWLPLCAPDVVPEKDVPLSDHPVDSKALFCIYVGEGMNVSVAVDKSIAGWLFFHGSGKIQASTLPQDMRLQRLLGHLSVLRAEKPG